MQDDRRYWIGFNLVKGIGPARTRLLLDYFGNLENAWLAPAGQLEKAGLSRKIAHRVLKARQEHDLDSITADLDRSGISVRTWQDVDYPRRLLEIDQPPPVLYSRGALAPQDMWAVAVVGTRRVTSYGRQVTAELAGFLAHNGVTVVSGFARGVDTIAHQSALANDGRTIAVLGCGVDIVYPPENRGLAADMLSSGYGVLISDYPVGTRPEGPNFPPRNRIISGLSMAIVVVEAGERSGALITALFALEQGREILAVPGNINGPHSVGTNRLISNGAHPYLKPADVLEILEWARVVQYPDKRRAAPETGTEEKIYQQLQHEPMRMDDLSAAVGLPVDQVAALLTVMEIKGLVRPIGGMKYSAV